MVDVVIVQYSLPDIKYDLLFTTLKSNSLLFNNPPLVKTGSTDKVLFSYLNFTLFKRIYL